MINADKQQGQDTLAMYSSVIDPYTPDCWYSNAHV